jgi:hypothetical protein
MARGAAGVMPPLRAINQPSFLSLKWDRVVVARLKISSFALINLFKSLGCCKKLLIGFSSCCLFSSCFLYWDGYRCLYLGLRERLGQLVVTLLLYGH